MHKHHHSQQSREEKHKHKHEHKHEHKHHHSKHRHHSEHKHRHHSKHHSDTEKDKQQKKKKKQAEEEKVEEELEEELASDDLSLLVAAAERIQTPYLRPDIFYSGDSTPHGTGSASTGRSSMEVLQEPAAVPPDALRPRKGRSKGRSKDTPAQSKQRRHKQARSMYEPDDAEARRRESHERVQSSLAAIRRIEEQYMRKQIV